MDRFHNYDCNKSCHWRFWAIFVVAAGVGWLASYRTPAKSASSHTAIRANLLLCANNGADAPAFWRSFARPKPAMFSAGPSSILPLASPLAGEELIPNQPGYCCLARIAVWLKAYGLLAPKSEGLRNMEDQDKQSSESITLHKPRWNELNRKC